jgi:kumamolisin
VPSVTPVSVNGAPVLTYAQIEQLPPQQRTEQLEDSVEVNMDVQIVAGLAPGADQIVYFSSFDERGWVELINQVIGGKPATATTVSVSWGLSEADPDWSAGAVKAIDERLQAAAALGITVCVAAGDDGSADTGGGVSTVFPRPSWQNVSIALVNPGAIDGRVVPDVAALAGPPLYDLIFMGKDSPNGGTSAATPTWASLIVLMAAASGQSWKPSFLLPLLYRRGPGGEAVGASGCTDVTSGDNTSSTLGNGYHAGPGFDAVSGWGVPDGKALLAAL